MKGCEDASYRRVFAVFTVIPALPYLPPLSRRTITLNKAYWTLVREQGFEQGRDPMISPAVNAWQEVEQGHRQPVSP
jgi:hypothetical protein